MLIVKVWLRHINIIFLSVCDSELRMETSFSNLDLTEVESASPSSPPPPAVHETQDPSDQERHLASKASLAYFTKKNHFEALAWLENLSVLRPMDPRVSGNLAVVSFLTSGGGFNELGKLQSDLKNTYINILSGLLGILINYHLDWFFCINMKITLIDMIT